MEVTIEKVNGIAIVELPGDILDASNVKEFKRDITSIIEHENKVIFDMHHLQFVDSSGLGSILSCLRSLNAKGGDLKLCSMSKSVRVLFELVRMHRIFDIYNTREEALPSFGD